MINSVTDRMRLAVFSGLVALGSAGMAHAAQPPGPRPPPQTPKAGAPIDLTGYWVSIVNEDWRWRMVTPAKGDFSSVPLNPAGRKVLDAWDVSQDGSCKAYGAAGVMRMPTRLHITWEGEDVLKIETDAGQQTRHLIFGKPRPAGAAHTLQGYSVASWSRTLPPPGFLGFNGPPRPNPPGGSLQVVTTDLAEGWLRRNGVPYSANTTVTEYFDRFPSPNGDEWFVVTTTVNDPEYLFEPFITSSHFRRERDGAKWDPQPCK